MARHVFGDEARSYPSYAPRVLWNRMLHRTVLGPLLGCSCSRCFHSRWRLVWSRELMQDRVAHARQYERLDREVRRLRAAVTELKDGPS